MAVQLVAASSQYLSNAAPPITAAPFTVGLLTMPTLIGDSQIRDIWALTDTGTANNRFAILKGSADIWSFACQAGGSTATATAGTTTVNQVAFVVARAISATNRRIDVLQFDGSTVHAQNTTNLTPSSLDTMTLGAQVLSTGANQFFDGRIAEFWYTNTDIQANGGQLDDSTLRQLAFAGPFSLPHIAKDIIEYRSFRQGLGSAQDVTNEVYVGNGVKQQTWSNLNGAIVGPHPPLRWDYRKPFENRRILIV